MKIARYHYKGKESYGVMQRERLLCLSALANRLKTDLPDDIASFIGDQTAPKKAEILLTKAKSCDLDAVSIPLNETRLLAPIASPPKILCLGLNFVTHVTETKEKKPEEPVIFRKPHTRHSGTKRQNCQTTLR